MLRSCEALRLQPERLFLQAAARVVCGEALASESQHVYAGCKALLELDVPADAAFCATIRWSVERVARKCTARTLAEMAASLMRHRLRPNAALYDALFDALAVVASKLSLGDVGIVCMALGTLQLVPPRAAVQALSQQCLQHRIQADSVEARPPASWLVCCVLAASFAATASTAAMPRLLGCGS